MVNRISRVAPFFISLLVAGCVIRVQGNGGGSSGATANATGPVVVNASKTPVKTCPDLDPKTTVTYTFDTLNEGKLEGQDGWTLVGGNSPMQIKNARGFDGSKAAVFLSFGQLVRKNDATFAVPKIAGTETTLAIEFDTHYDGMVGGATSEFMLVSAASMTGELRSTSTSPWIGLKSGQINYRQAAMGEQIAAPVPSDVQPGDWIRLRLVMDLTDKSNGKNGSAFVFVKNMTKKDTVFRAVTQLQNLDAHLERNVSPPTTWDGMYIRFDEPADYHTDNLRVSPAANCK